MTKEPTSAAFLDLERLRSLAELTDGGIYLIIDEFSDNLMNRIRAIGVEVERRDADAISNQVHQLKGSAANCGFSQLTAVLSKPRENHWIDVAAMEKCALDSIEVWKLFLAREVLDYPDLDLSPTGG